MDNEKFREEAGALFKKYGFEKVTIELTNENEPINIMHSEYFFIQLGI